ncbi:MAG: hypothetical protein Q9182_006394 [Xanthomendoza sp. 2 TL-2023]
MDSDERTVVPWERMPETPSRYFPDLNRESRAGQLLRRNLPDVAASVAPLPNPSPCLAEELIDLSTYWLTLLSRLVHKVATGDAVARYEREEIERLMADNAMMDVQPVDALNDRVKALKYDGNQLFFCRKIALLIATSRCMASMLVQCQERCQNAWDGTNFHKPPTVTSDEPINPLVNTGPGLNLVYRSTQQPTAALPPAAPSIPPVINSQAATITQAFVGDDIDEDQDDNEAEEIVLRALEQLGNARGKGQHTCPLGTACHKGGFVGPEQPRVFGQNAAYRSANPGILSSSFDCCHFIDLTSYHFACRSED